MISELIIFDKTIHGKIYMTQKKVFLFSLISIILMYCLNLYHESQKLMRNDFDELITLFPCIFLVLNLYLRRVLPKDRIY
jgi:uncharacterized membrane protein (DUF373 family)